MTWISLVCLLALSSAAFGQSSYGVFSGSSLFKPKPVVPLPLPTPVLDMPPRPVPVSSGGYGSYDKFESRRLSFDLPKPATLPLSEADILCKGKPEGHIIVLLAGEKFIICTTDSKGDEFFCPKGLLYNDETKRCERKYNPNKNPCASQPCLNGGRCIPTQYTYQCDCALGFSGRTCELDASVCQQQQPCGQSYDSFCQSFRVGSALKHLCIHQEGRVYGLSSQQTFPNPCLTSEGIHPLAFGNKGFIMCDGDSMFVESCPGETIWDSFTKVCVWADLPTAPTVSAMPMQFSSGFSAQLAPQEPVALPRVESASPVRPTGFSSNQNAFVLPTVDSSADRFRSGGGGGGGGGSEDFQRRTFTRGDFQPSSRPQENIRLITDRPFSFPGAGLPGASSTTRFDEELDRPTRGQFPEDDSFSNSIRFPSRPVTPNPFENREEIDRPDLFANSPGASSGRNLFPGESFLSNDFFRRSDATRRSNSPGRF